MHNTMQTVHTLFALGLGALALYVGVMVYWQWLKEKDKTGWERLRATAQDSATILWSKFAMVVAGLVGDLDDIAGMLGASPDLQQKITDIFGSPKIVATALVVFAVGAVIARKRSL
jgi:hypothetical protein